MSTKLLTKHLQRMEDVKLPTYKRLFAAERAMVNLRDGSHAHKRAYNVYCELTKVIK